MKPLSILVFSCLFLGLPFIVTAREVPGSLEKIQFMDIDERSSDDFSRHAAQGILDGTSHSGAGTTYYGGTTWDPVDGRWEALIDSVWTFDSGVATQIIVGSAANYPGVNPHKPAGLHATMEGWIGKDFSYSEVTYFRVLSDTDPRWGADVCVGSGAVGSPGVLGGSYSFWCGALPEEADVGCYVDGQGYGNNWTVCMGKTYTNYMGGSITLDFDYINESESGFDFTKVEVDTSGDGSGITLVVQYDGAVAGHETLVLTPGFQLPAVPPDSIRIRFCFSSDGAWSDEDGLFTTTCGAFAVDNILLSGAISDGPATFEGGADGGWKVFPAKPGRGGEWSNLVDWATVPVYTNCTCDLDGNVLVFEDLTVPGVSHNFFQDNIAGSPWIDLDPAHSGPGKFIETHIYANLSLLNYIFAQFLVKWYPDPCPRTGQDLESPWSSTGFVFFFGGVPTCTPGTGFGVRIDFGEFIPESATDVRAGLGVLSFCRFFADCSGLSNITPVYDNVRLGVFGNTGAPLIDINTVNHPQDAFPANGTLRSDAPGRFDAGNVVNDSQPEINTNLGDTLTVHGAIGGAEVHVELRVTPGFDIDATALANFYARLTPQGGGWYSARLDTAELGMSQAINGSWMTTYHENDPHRQSPGDRDLDPTDTFGAGHLANDIFPDNLFTPGTRVDLFFRTRYLTESSWFLLPDTTGGSSMEWECLPSSMAPDGQGGTEWNCVLYVDHFDGRGAQGWIEAGLGAVLGYSGANAEGTSWDRYDVRAPSSQQACFGRPLGAVYGANVIQAAAYKTILWNSGNLNAFNLVKEDAEVLVPWMTLLDLAGNNLYLSGDGIAHSMTVESASNPMSLVLLEDIMGVGENCNTVRNQNCPQGTPEDSAPCIPLDPVTGTVASLTRSFFHDAQGNGCPQHRSYDVLDVGSPLYGAVATGDERYDNSAAGGKIASWASVATDALGGGANPMYRTLIDGLSVHYRRDTFLGPCDFNGNASPVTERLNEVLAFFGSGTAQQCNDFRGGAIGVPGEPEVQTRTRLSGISPNPLSAGSMGRITFTLAREGKARIDVFDLNGRRVNTVFDGISLEGENTAVWDGRDAAGREVAAGVYFYRLDAGGKVMSKKMVVVRGR